MFQNKKKHLGFGELIKLIRPFFLPKTIQVMDCGNYYGVLSNGELDSVLFEEEIYQINGNLYSFLIVCNGKENVPPPTVFLLSILIKISSLKISSL